MAGKKPIKSAKRAAGGSSRRALFHPGWIAVPILIGLLAIFYPDASIVLAIGLMPTMVTAAVAQGPGSGARTLSVALFNLSGVLQVLAELDGPKYAGLGASGPMSDVYAWLMMYGAAALGGMLNWLAPFVAAAILTYLDRADMRRLLNARRELMNEWGDEVADDNA